jgi:coenzyme F420 hydrogenase subunit beta
MRPAAKTVAQDLRSTVIAGGYCIGCGSCAAVKGSPITMADDGYGRIQAVLDPDADLPMGLQIEKVCPFAAGNPNEDETGAWLFDAVGASHDPRLGWWRGLWAGHVAEGEFRSRGSSGGMGNWIASELLRRGEVDAVLHVQPDVDGRLFGFSISTSLGELNKGAKSRYYPVEMSQVLRHVAREPGRYALIGVPCFIKAARLLARQEPAIAERLRYTISLICGHLKSDSFAAMFGWQLGIAPSKVDGIDFRVKNEHGPANRYSIAVSGKGGDGGQLYRSARNDSFLGSPWSYGLFKYRACEFCDDVFGETADVTVGDAWLPGWLDDSGGANVVVSRNPAIDRIIREGIAEEKLALGEITADQVARSQEAGLRHRRDGLAIRLADAERKGQWHPPKRVASDLLRLPFRLRTVYRLRQILAERSHWAFKDAMNADDFSIFVRRMVPLMTLHDIVNSRRMSRRRAMIFLMGLIGREPGARFRAKSRRELPAPSLRREGAME